MANFSIFNIGVPNVDVMKKYLFELEFKPTGENNTLKQIFTGNGKRPAFTVRANTAVIPGKSFGEISVHHMGTAMFYPGKAVTDGELSVTFDEYQDMYVSEALYQWQNMIQNTGGVDADDISAELTDTLGASTSNSIKDYSATITLRLYDSTNTLLPYAYKFLYCFPKDFQQADLAYEDDGKVTRQVTFKYSIAQMIESVNL